MDYQTFRPHPDLKSLIKCYWTLEAPAATNPQKQRIVPDGCIEMIFILGDHIKRYTSETNFILQPRAMVLGQITEPFYVQPTGNIHSFAARFYPFGFANFVKAPIQDLANTETPIQLLFEEPDATELQQKIFEAKNTAERIGIVESFLFDKLSDKQTIDSIVKSTIDALLTTNGSSAINSILQEDLSKRRRLERNFTRQIGISPKQLGRVIRLQSALKMLLDKEPGSLTEIAYQSEYFDQAHFNKDFKKLTGVNPKKFVGNEQMFLSALLYSKD